MVLHCRQIYSLSWRSIVLACLPNVSVLVAAQPRIVHHVDDNFRTKVTQVYRKYIPANGAVLDLMSSWVSHLPTDVTYSMVVGHGMNAQEVSKEALLHSAMHVELT